MRLPFKPIGLHSDNPIPADEVPTDFSADAETESALTTPSPPSTSSSTDGLNNASTGPAVSNGEEADEKSEGEEEKKELIDWWAYVISKIKAAKVWAAAVTTKIHQGTTEPARERVR